MKENIDEDCFRAYLSECIELNANKINFKNSLIDNFPAQLKRFGLMVDMGEISLPTSSFTSPFSGLDSIASAFIHHVSRLWPPVPEYIGIPLESLMTTPVEHSLEWLKESNEGLYSGYMPDVEDFDEKFMTDRVLKAFLGSNGNNIRHFDVDAIASKYLNIAILKTPMAIKCLPEFRITKKMVDMAIKGNPNVFAHIDEKWQTDAMVKSCVSRQGLLLWHVKDEFKSYENCKIAVGMTGTAMRFVPADVADRALCDLALESVPSCACFFPPHLANFEEMVDSFVDQPSQVRKANFNGYSFDVDKMLTAVASRFPDILNFIPSPRMTDGVIKAALTASPIHLGYLASEFVTQEVCEFAVSRDPLAITYVPLTLRPSVSLAVKQAKQTQDQLSPGL